MLTVRNLRKEYDTVVAVDGVSLDVRRGELFGLLGPNGAGKTTTIRTVLNIIQPDAGEIAFDGKPFTPSMWDIIGYLPEERGLYRKSKIINAILYFASLKGLAPKDARPLAAYWLERFGLKGEAYRKIEELSKGNQQKVQLIISIIHRPQLLILDEPFTGLDPVNQILLKDVLMELRQKNVAIIFSTHQMEQVEKMCDNICLINRGKPVLNGPLAEVKKQYGKNSIRVEFEGDASFLKTAPDVRRADVYQNYAELELADMTRSGALLKSLNERVALRKFEVVEPSLNSIFLDVVGGPALAEEAAAKPVPATPSAVRLDLRTMMNEPRLRKAILSMAGIPVVAVALIAANGGDLTSQWQPLALLGAVFAVAVVQFAVALRKVKAERFNRPATEVPRER
jgi:ABC-2 type transport system ATP-binding protein